MAIAALSRFASHAFERVLDVALNEQDPARAASALVTLRRIAAFDALPPEDLVRLVEVAGLRMATAQGPRVWQAALELGIATGDSQLRQTVARIASGTIEPAFSEREHLQLWVRTAARKALGGAESS
jgi:hypothetical protein